MSSIIELNNISKTFDNKKKITVLKNLNFKFKKGKIYFIKIKPNSASSTHIRENIDDQNVLSEGLDDDVLKYLQEHKIYNKYD